MSKENSRALTLYFKEANIEAAAKTAALGQAVEMGQGVKWRGHFVCLFSPSGSIVRTKPKSPDLHLLPTKTSLSGKVVISGREKLTQRFRC